MRRVGAAAAPPGAWFNYLIATPQLVSLGTANGTLPGVPATRSFGVARVGGSSDVMMMARKAIVAGGARLRATPPASHRAANIIAAGSLHVDVQVSPVSFAAFFR